MRKKTSLLMIYTGGTIGMVQDVQKGTLQPFNFENIMEHLPELRNLEIDLQLKSLEHPIDSSNMNPGFWIEIAKVIQKNYKNFDGFVVLHGSDTMAYTASALSFMLENLSKPVILTGSQLPIGVIRTDGKENLISAIEIAAAKIKEKSVVPEVCIYFEYKLYRGNRAHKFNSENFKAFISPNYPTLAEAGVHIKYNYAAINKASEKKLIVHDKLDTNIAILTLFPGIQRNVVNAVLNTKGLKAIILETFGSGNAPNNKWFIEELKKALAKGIIIFNVTQCKGGSVELGKYETSKEMEEIGVIGGSDITAEAAITKLMFLLGKELSKEKVEKFLGVSLRGESL